MDTPPKGARVRIYPHGAPSQFAHGRVILSDRRGVALAFDGIPPFATSKPGTMPASRNHTVTMILTRHKVGPWIEYTHGRRYEIEELYD